MAEPEMESHQDIIRGWQKNCMVYIQKVNDDAIVPVIRLALEVLYAASRPNYEPERTDKALTALKDQLNKSFAAEDCQDRLRVLYFGLIESLLFSMGELAKKRKEQLRYLPLESRCVSVIDLEKEAKLEPFVPDPEPILLSDDEDEPMNEDGSQRAPAERADEYLATAALRLFAKLEQKQPIADGDVDTVAPAMMLTVKEEKKQPIADVDFDSVAPAMMLPAKVEKKQPIADEDVDTVAPVMMLPAKVEKKAPEEIAAINWGTPARNVVKTEAVRAEDKKGQEKEMENEKAPVEKAPQPQLSTVARSPSVLPPSIGFSLPAVSPPSAVAVNVVKKEVAKAEDKKGKEMEKNGKGMEMDKAPQPQPAAARPLSALPPSHGFSLSSLPPSGGFLLSSGLSATPAPSIGPPPRSYGPSQSVAPFLSGGSRPKRVSAQAIDFVALNRGGATLRDKHATATPARRRGEKASEVRSSMRRVSAGGGVVKAKEVKHATATPVRRPQKASEARSSMRRVSAGGGVVKAKEVKKPVGRPRKLQPTVASRESTATKEEGVPRKSLTSESDSTPGKQEITKQVQAELIQQPEEEEKAQSLEYVASICSERPLGIMNCYLCGRRIDSVCEYVGHLSNTHKTTITQLGLWFKCECGHMGRTSSHEISKQPHCGGHYSTTTNGEDEADGEEVVVVLDDEEVEVKDEPMPASEAGMEGEPTGEPMEVQENEKEKEREEEEEEVEENPGCFLCEVRPSTIGGYVTHLKNTHKTTLIMQGRLLRCACGWCIRSGHTVLQHNKKTTCHGDSFRLSLMADEEPEVEVRADSRDRKEVIRIGAGTEQEAGNQAGAGDKDGVPEPEDEDMMDDEAGDDGLLGNDGWHPKCFLCEERPPTIMAFIVHLYKDHDATLAKFGYALQCDCGHKVRTQYAGEEVPRHPRNGKCAGDKFRVTKAPEGEEEGDEASDGGEGGPPTKPFFGPPTLSTFCFSFD